MASTYTAVPEAVAKRSPGPPAAEDVVSPIVASTPAPGPSTSRFDVLPQEEALNEALAMHTVSPLTTPPGSSQRGTSLPPSCVGRTATDAEPVGSSHGGGPAARQRALRPLVLRTLDTVIYFLLALAIVVACRKVC